MSTRSRLVLLLSVLAASMVPSLPAAGSVHGAGPDHVVGCDDAGKRVTITANSRLDGRCVYSGGFDITASNVTLDCRGALLQHTSSDGTNGIVIAVDADANLANVTIRNCRIDGFEHGIDLVRNRAGGVFLYTNCGENVHTDPADWLDHRYGAQHNDITANLIAGRGTGVWIGSRMGENVYTMDCSDVPYVSGPLRSITLDRAPYNTMRGNLVVGADFGVRVEDDHATITRNRFVASDAADAAVVVGTPYRTTALGEPVADTVVARNVSSIAGNASPYRWVDGVSRLHKDQNVALGRISRFCRAPDVPRGPFVMVDAFALQDPTQPPVSPPPYPVPSLGVLPACP